jgi:hypothetical protein
LLNSPEALLDEHLDALLIRGSSTTHEEPLKAAVHDVSFELAGSKATRCE